MDAWLSHSHSRFELGREVRAEDGVPTLPIIEHLDLLEDVLLRFVSRGTLPMVHELTLECPEETFDAGDVPAVPFLAHAGCNTVSG